MGCRSGCYGYSRCNTYCGPYPNYYPGCGYGISCGFPYPFLAGCGPCGPCAPYGGCYGYGYGCGGCGC